jgi:hypothetical protein
MANKMTKKDYFAILSTIVAEVNPTNSADILAFIQHEVELLEKKNSAKSSKPTKTQLANEGLKDAIIATLAEIDKPVTITEMQKYNPDLATDEKGETISNQRVSALLRQLIDCGTVVRTTEKKKAYFSLAVED